MEKKGEEGNNYEELTPDNMIDYMKTLPKNVRKLLGDLDHLQIEEISDGNINMVYLLKNSKSGEKMVLKQALPFLRKYRDWPLTLSRANFEVQVLKLEKEAAPEHVPTVYHFDEEKRAILMECVSPHIVLRGGMVEKIQYPHLGEHLGTFLANTLFATSDFCLSSKEKKKLIKIFSENWEMCELTENVIFSYPFRDHPLNSCAPLTEEIAASLRKDLKVRVRVSELLRSFISSTEAVLHGDLHSGSVMVTPTSTVCIDPEFGYVGPFGFDIGSLLANFFLSFFSHMQGKYIKNPNEEERKQEMIYQKYLLSQIIIIWNTFSQQFCELWGKEEKEKEGEEGKKNNLGTHFFCLEGELELAQKSFLSNLEKDVLGYAGTEIIRRLIGVAHVEDFLGIQEEEARGKCEVMGVGFARELLRGEIDGVKEAVERAKELGGTE